MESLTTIFDRYNSDKNSSFHNYCRQYENLMRDFRDKSFNFLEIGVFKGESVKIWRDVFPNAKKIVAVDINPECKQYENPEKNIFIEIGDSSNTEFMNSVNDKHGPFTIVLDDGSHTNKDVILGFEHMFPLLVDEGLYIVEDTICFKEKYYVHGGYPNHLDYFAKYTPFLNQWRFDSTDGVRDNCVDPFKIMKKTSNVFEASIDMITFGVSIIAIHKKVRAHWFTI